MVHFFHGATCKLKTRVSEVTCDLCSYVKISEITEISLLL